MKSLEDHIKANQKARELGPIEVSKFILKNPYSWESNFLKQVVNEYQFLKKLQKKVPEWAEKEVLGYNKKAVEQCSSALTAAFRFRNIQAESTLDLTGGYGVDSYFLSKKSTSHHYCEPNAELYEIVKHNFNALNVPNVNFHNMSAEEFLSTNSRKFDLIYIDPDRRDSTNARKFRLEDLQPDILELQKDFALHAKQFMIKLSPILDIKSILSTVQNVSKILIISIKNDVKELIVIVEPSLNKKLSTVAANYNGIAWEIDETSIAEDYQTPDFSRPLKYLYEPNSALMKTMAWSYISNQYCVKKIAPMSHYYTANELIENFPGRVFKVLEVQAFQKKQFKSWTNGSYSVLSRNFGQTAQKLKSQFKISESDTDFLIFTSDFSNSKIVIKTTKINTL